LSGVLPDAKLAAAAVSLLFYPLFMKKILLLLSFYCFTGIVSAQNALNMVKLASWDDDTLPAYPAFNNQYAACWGLKVNGREIAVLGATRQIFFFDVTDPTQPKLIGKFAGTTITAWREFRSYKNRIYAVSDNTNEGLMIFDLNKAPGTITRTYWSNEFFNNAHTITLDTLSGRIYLNGTNVASQGLLVLDVKQNPDKPTVLANIALAGGYIHDSYVRNDTVYASSGFEGFYVFDFKTPTTPRTLAQITTGGYNHNSWLTSDGKFAFITEEIPQGRPIRVIDLRKLSKGEIEPAHKFLNGLLPGGDTLAIPHNVYIKGNQLFVSQYEDGLLVYNIDNPLQPKLIGRYDTHPQNTKYNRYLGNWGNYPWLPSGTIICSDMQNGLVLLKMENTSATNDPDGLPGASLFPNPASESLSIRIGDAVADWSYRLMNTAGQTLLQGQIKGQNETQLSTGTLPTGLYFVELTAKGTGRAVKKVAIQNRY
jgi:choice-of-anchor B domain-containing protein